MMMTTMARDYDSNDNDDRCDDAAYEDECDEYGHFWQLLPIKHEVGS